MTALADNTTVVGMPTMGAVTALAGNTAVVVVRGGYSTTLDAQPNG